MAGTLTSHTVRERIRHYQARKKWYRSLSQRAAVGMLVADIEENNPALLMIERAHAEGDPWSGHMAFPGGKHDTDDRHITETVMRECHEELGIPAGQLQRVGRLSDVLARPYRLQQKPMVVSPLLLKHSEPLDFQPNEEVADVVWVPISLFRNPDNRKSMEWQRNGHRHKLPCYFYQGRRIWGLSLLMIDELMTEIEATAGATP